MVPTLVSGSRMIALVHERLALAIADQTTLDGTTGAQRSIGTSSRLEDCDAH
jgi:hypothetical protein